MLINKDSLKQLDDENLKKVQGGGYYAPSDGYTYTDENNNEYNVVDWNWGCPAGVSSARSCLYCQYFQYLPSKINGWCGYCTYTKVTD